ncbi:unnamed protein product [Somion occarium]|uniref:Ribosome biogenesis protein SLX9 n=1 Tax=Somion occarium TaxID=3059160 RepID=A0ABP1CL03_9APHY
MPVTSKLYNHHCLPVSSSRTSIFYSTVPVFLNMPKAARSKQRLFHQQTVKPSTRKFADGNTVEHVEVGSHADTTGNEILAEMATSEEPSKVMKKKDKLAMKHELFLQRLESAQSPYSKSHERRLKRKAKEQVAGGMNDIQAALSAVAGETADTDADSVPHASADDSIKVPSKPKPGQIGEGKSGPLSKTQRKKALQTERLRIPMILSNPEFASNPFQTIRTHAQNTLLKHQTPP